MFLKKTVSFLMLPYPVALMLLVAGAVLLWCTARQRTGKALVTAGCVLLLLLSCGPLTGWCLSPLRRYRPLPSLAGAPGARWIVVLGAGYSSSPDLPATSRLDSSTLERLVEGVRLYRTQSGAKLLVSGGAFAGRATSQARVMAQAAEALGVPAVDVRLEDLSDDTQDEARLVRGIVGGQPVVLVTSAIHMRRAVGLFEKQGLRVTPAPAGYWWEGWSILPSVGSLRAAAAAEHEYLGLLWSHLRGTL